MIQLSLSNLMILYIVGGMVTLFGVWLHTEWKRKRAERAANRYRILCRICAVEFEDRSDEVTPQCPHCRHLNERIPIRQI